MAKNAAKGIAVITGGSRGIGKGIALKLSEDGYNIAINYLKDENSADRTAKEISHFGYTAITVQADVTKSDQVINMISDVVDRLGGIDILVNNVGPFIVKSIDQSTEQDWLDMIHGNLTSAYNCAKAALPHIRQAKGSIVFLGGPNAEQLRAAPNTGAYTIAKNGVVALAKTLAREEAKHGVRINVVNPGLIKTKELEEKQEQSMISQIPLKRLGTPQDIAEAVSFLVSDKASYITGAVLNVSGGLWV